MEETFVTEPKRYQLKKEAAAAVRQNHPWIFRQGVSTAAEPFSSGQVLKLVGAANDVLGYGIYEPEGLIAIRVLKQGTTIPDENWVKARIDKALEKRANIRKFTNAFRALHGENDGMPGIVIDVYDRTGVLQTYAASVDKLGEFAAKYIAEKLDLRNVLWKFPVKRKVAREDVVLKGEAPGEVKIKEGKLELTIPIEAGQKSGAFLDLRGLRKWVTSQKLAGKRVLNLFSYTGSLGLAAEVAGASDIWNVDVSRGALDVAKRLHTKDAKKHQFIEADIFEWFATLNPKEKFDLIIIDPPLMASKTHQVDVALRTYRKLYVEALKHIRPFGTIVACCCTSRIKRGNFELTAAQVLGQRGKKLASLPHEDDHPIGFPEGDYLKILAFQIRG